MARYFLNTPALTFGDRLLGSALTISAVACLFVGAATMFGPIAPLSSIESWDALGIFLLFVVHGVLYAVRQGQLGGPVGGFFRLGYLAREHHPFRVYPRFIALWFAWAGLVLCGLMGLFAKAPALLLGSPLLYPLLVATLLLVFAPIIVLAIVFARRTRLGRTRP